MRSLERTWCNATCESARAQVRTSDLRLRPQRCRPAQVSSSSCIRRRCWNRKPSPGLSRASPPLRGRPGTRTDLSKHFEPMRTRRQAAGEAASLMALLLFSGASSELPFCPNKQLGGWGGGGLLEDSVSPETSRQRGTLNIAHHPLLPHHLMPKGGGGREDLVIQKPSSESLSKAVGKMGKKERNMYN